MIYNAFKRLFDVVVSAAVLIVALPVYLLIALGIKLSSKGPVLYISERVGRNGRVFRLYKFRSMHIKAENAVENQYLVNTQRIFAFGELLRKSKLDELPQMLNVLCGHMSFIGPRPYPRSVADRLFVGDNRVITSIRPGLACLDSLYDYAHGDLFTADAEYYRDNIIPVRTELARLYVERRNIALDVHCILRTIQLIFQIMVMRRREFALTGYELEAVRNMKDKGLLPVNAQQ